MSRYTEWRGKHARVVDSHIPPVNYIDRLAQYEDEDEDGRLLHLPVPLGTVVYYVHDKCTGGQWCPFEGGYGTDRCHTDDPTVCRAFYEPVHFSLRLFDGWGEYVFRTDYEAQEEVDRRNKK